MTPAKLTVFLSNRLEMLYQQLKQALFIEGNTPFHRRLVVVYGPAMQSWLMLQLANDPDINVAMGLEFVYLNKAFEQLAQLFGTQSTGYLPPSLELALAIETEIRRILHAFPYLSPAEQTAWMPLVHYLKLEPTALDSRLKLTRKMERRLTTLSRQVATQFQDYGRYAGAHIETWTEHWQARLWHTLYKTNSQWTYPYQLLQQPLRRRSHYSIFFFSISFLTQVEWTFLLRLSEHIPVHTYSLSPCAVFWSDVRSDRESAYLQTYWQKKIGTDSPQLLQLEELLRDCNPLLANFGRLGRERACQIEESQVDTRAYYLLPDHTQPMITDHWTEDLSFYPSSGPLTLLHALQADLLLMCNPLKREVVDIDCQDLSLQLHMAPNRRREVEILYHNLLHLLTKDPSIEPCDIVVMAPQIADYTPYLHSIFGAPDSPFDFQILDLGWQQQSELVQGFLQLLALSTSRWDASNVLQLFEHPSFQRRQQLSTSDYQLIQTWVEQAGIWWGDNWLHRNELLERRHCSRPMVEETPIGTWDYGLTRLLLGLTNTSSSSDHWPLDTPPCENIEFAHSDLLDKWMRLLHSLRDDLTCLYDETVMTLEDWVEYLTGILEMYLAPDWQDESSVSAYEDLKTQIGVLRQSRQVCGNTKFPFTTISIHLQALLEQRGVIYHEHQVQAIRFCSLVPLRTIPSKIIALMGMQEGAFPRNTHASSLDLLHGRSDYCPTGADYDRYLFLEAIQSAQEHFLISYQGYHPKDHRELQPALAVEELWNYLNRHYTVLEKSVSESCFYRHPLDDCDSLYFQNKSGLHNFSKADYLAAQLLTTPPTQLPHRFFDAFTFIAPTRLLPDKTCIDLKSLCAVARNPIKFHLNRTLSIYLPDKEKGGCRSEESLILTALDKYLLKQRALIEPLDKVFYRADKEGRLPFGMFKTVAKRQIEGDFVDIRHNLQKCAAWPLDLLQFEFCPSCQMPQQMGANKWRLPPIPVVYPDGYTLYIVGKLPSVSAHGLVSMQRGGLADAWKMWPQFLAYHWSTRQLAEHFNPQLLFIHSTQPKRAFFDDAMPYLQQFVDYYMICLEKISPLLPDWIHSIFTGDREALKLKMAQHFTDTPFGGYHSPDVQWILNRDHLPCPEQAIMMWKEPTEVLVGGLMHAWYPSTKLDIIKAEII